MSVIFARNSLDTGKSVNKEELINPKFECDIFINDIKFSNDITINKENKIIYLFKNKYTDLSDMFKDCESLISIDLSNFDSNDITSISEMFYNCKNLTSINFTNF